MKRNLFLVSATILGLSFSVVPFIKNSEVNSVELNQDKNTSNNQKESGLKYLDDIKNLNKSIGSLKSLKTLSIINSFKNANKIFSDKKVNVKVFNENSATLTIDDYIGYINVNFTTSGLSSLFDNNDLGIQTSYDINNVVQAIENKNTDFSLFDKSNLTYEFNSINEFSVYSKILNSSSKFAISPQNLRTIVTNTVIQKNVKNPYNSTEILNDIYEINPILNLDKSIISIVKDSFSYNGCIIMSTNSFDQVTKININYRIDDFSYAINNTSLGEIGSFKKADIINNLLDNNKILKDYNKSNRLGIEVLKVNLNNSLIRLSKKGTSIYKDYTFLHKANNISVLLESNSLSSKLTHYNQDNAVELIRNSLVNTNPYLKELNKNDLIIQNINAKNTSNNQLGEVSFNLSIRNYNGLEKIEGSILKTDLNNEVYNKSLGNDINWNNSNDIINIFKQKNNNIDLNELNKINVTKYDNFSVSAKNSSLTYYGEVSISFGTNLSRTSGISAKVLDNNDSDYGYNGNGSIGNRAYLAIHLGENQGTSNIAKLEMSLGTKYNLGIKRDSFTNVNNKYLKVGYEYLTTKLASDEYGDLKFDSNKLHEFDKSGELNIPLSQVIDGGISGSIQTTFNNYPIRNRDGGWFNTCPSGSTGYRTVDGIVKYDIKFLSNGDFYMYATNYFNISKGVECYGQTIRTQFSVNYINIS
ncbi:hypothetical protein SCORR_v1c07910 [Spiroplasma corruscae]|uniref:Uncharacterized protein n=1 Tax=Spiroplasma corruscae TaxID=216934 RepID=A0A222EQP4_9MOLU|nr:hypothetical protein [Spiroplasma corruscae]ASP28563.1 hypothetical protein SCORR_v1c07910 [Spiroplasma corruscae]